MSLKSTLFAIAMVMILLLPIGRILRDQNPRTCFAFTFDEGYFAQAASQWSEGKGYRMPESLPFDPSITVGLPMAWGADAIHGWTGEDIANSGRIFVFACFILLLLVLGRNAYRIDQSWVAVPITLGIFGYGLSKIAFGPYFAFGFLGEMPAFVLGALAYRALDDKNFFRAGILTVGVFVMKPTFLFFLPAVGLAALLHSGKATFKTGIAIAASLGLVIYGIAHARNQAIADYLAYFFKESSRIAHFSPAGTPLDHYGDFKNPPAVFSALFLLFGAYATARARRVSPSQVAAFFLFLSATIYFFVIGQRPVEKQWSALFCLTLIGFAIPWGTLIASRFTGWTSKEFMRAIVLAVAVTAVFSVAHDVLHKYKHAPETACASKEQTAINAKLRELADHGEVTKANLGAWITHHAYEYTLYRLPFEVNYQKEWKAFGPTLPKWLYGETKSLFPSPPECTPEFRGETFALLRCEKKASAIPAPQKPKRTHSGA